MVMSVEPVGHALVYVDHAVAGHMQAAGLALPWPQQLLFSLCCSFSADLQVLSQLCLSAKIRLECLFSWSQLCNSFPLLCPLNLSSFCPCSPGMICLLGSLLPIVIRCPPPCWDQGICILYSCHQALSLSLVDLKISRTHHVNLNPPTSSPLLEIISSYIHF